VICVCASNARRQEGTIVTDRQHGPFGALRAPLATLLRAPDVSACCSAHRRRASASPRIAGGRGCSYLPSRCLSHLLVLVQLLRLDADDLAYALALVCAGQLRHGKLGGHDGDDRLSAISAEVDAVYEWNIKDMLEHGRSAHLYTTSNRASVQLGAEAGPEMGLCTLRGEPNFLASQVADHCRKVHGCSYLFVHVLGCGRPLLHGRARRYIRP
jgi:hypothetical protein